MQREEFQNIIENAIRAAGYRGAAAEALRKVGREATGATVGDFLGCPLDLAGLYNSPASATNWKFVNAFDPAIPRREGLYVRIED